MDPITLNSIDRGALDADFTDLHIAYQEAHLLFNQSLDAKTKQSAQRIMTLIRCFINSTAQLGIHAKQNWDEFKATLSE